MYLSLLFFDLIIFQFFRDHQNDRTWPSTFLEFLRGHPTVKTRVYEDFKGKIIAFRE